jgi:phosphohistidine phosphatase
MRLYLIQHGLSLSQEEDPRRPLSQQGRDQTQKIAGFLKSRDIKVDYIWHSDKLRAAQTAQIISEFLSGAQLKQRNDLKPLDPVDKFPSEFLRLNKDIAVIGHLPFLQKLTSLLVAGQENLELVSFRYSGVVCLDYQGGWRVAWFLVPGLI